MGLIGEGLLASSSGRSYAQDMPASSHQIVGFQRFHHGLMLTPPKEPVNSLRA